MKDQLTYYGNPILRKKADRILVFDPMLKEVVQRMITVMVEHKGIGLAAPQIGRSIALFITSIPHEDSNGKLHDGPIKIYLNPQIIEYSQEEHKRIEGCLSIPSIYEEVSRPITITVKAQDLEGNEFTETCYGLEARAILHENDHLNGVLFIDRIDRKKRKEIDPILRQIKKKYHP